MATLATRELTRGEEAISIFCDTLARDIAAKNSDLREENVKLSKVSESLFELQVKNGDEIIQIDIRSFDSEINDHYVFSVANSPEIPHRRLKSFYCIVNGVFILQSPMRCAPKLKVTDDEQVQLTLNLSGVVLRGKLKDYGGTVEDMQYIIDTNQYAFFNAMMGAVNVETGRPHSMLTRFVGRNALEESTFVLENVFVHKALIGPTLETVVEGATTASYACGGLLTADDSDAITEAFPLQKNIAQVTATGKDLHGVNQELLKRRDVFQTVRSYNEESNETLFQLHLDKGIVGKMIYSQDQDNFPPAWVVQPKAGEEVILPLSSLSAVMITLGNVSICSGANAHMDAIHMRNGFVLKWNGIWETEAVFLFDDTCLEHLREPHFFARVDQTLIPESNSNRNVRVGDERVSRIVGMTVRLAFVQMKLESLQDHLELLGFHKDALESQETNQEDSVGEADRGGADDEGNVEYNEQGSDTADGGGPGDGGATP